MPGARGQIVVQIVLEAHAWTHVARPSNRLDALHGCRIHNRSSRALQIVNRGLKHAHDFGIGRRPVVRLMQHADHGARKAIAIERA